MDAQLKQDREKRGEILRRALSLAEKYFERQESLPPGVFIPSMRKDELPEQGEGAIKTLEFFEKNFSHLLSNSAGPRYFGFVTGGSTPASVAADWLVSAYDQNACGSTDSIAPHLEHQTISYFRQLFGLQHDYYGSFVTGATMANFVGLAQARQWAGEQRGVDISNDGLGSLEITVAGATPHSSIIKSLSMLGLGRRSMHRLETLKGREAVDLSKLEEFLSNHRQPVIVIASAGTVNTGDFDDLLAIGALKRKHNFWMHVDAAFGGFAACSEKYQHLLRGINEADSITIDAHKWLNVPYDAAMQFTRHQPLQLKIFHNSAAYLGDPEKSPDFFHYTPESSRRWRALPAWFSLRAYGKNGYREIVERTCASARQLGERISASHRFRLLSTVHLNIVCFTLNHSDLTSERVQTFVNAVRDDGRVYFTPTVYKSIPAIRAAVSNWQTTPADMEIAFEVITNVWDRLSALDGKPANIKAF